MPPTTLLLDFNHKPGYEIPIKHKEVIRQLYGFVKILIEGLIECYWLGRIIIIKILEYEKLEYIRHKRGLTIILSNSKVNEIIKYLLSGWDEWILD